MKGLVRLPATTSRPFVLGAALWLVSVVFFVVQAVAQAASTRPYHLTTNLISDLGNTACGPDICSPRHTLVNATFVVVGVCHLAGALLTVKAWPRQRLGLVGAGFIAVAGAGLVVAGLAPENVNGALHAAGALTGLIALNLGLIALGVSMLAGRPGPGRLTMSAGIVGFVGLGTFLARPTGTAERLADWPGAAMVVILGAMLLAVAAAGRSTHATGGTSPTSPGP